jgi:hypothetical protein
MSLRAYGPDVSSHGYFQGRPLLESDGPVFTDTQVGLKFTWPRGWVLQARSADSPHAHRAERLLVKYKRVTPAEPDARLRVGVVDVTDDVLPAEFLRGRPVPEPGWKVTKPIEEKLTVGGQPAARVTFGGPFNPDQKTKPRDYTCELVAARNGPRWILFAGTFDTADEQSRQQIRDAIESVIFQR